MEGRTTEFVPLTAAATTDEKSSVRKRLSYPEFLAEILSSSSCSCSSSSSSSAVLVSAPALAGMTRGELFLEQLAMFSEGDDLSDLLPIPDLVLHDDDEQERDYTEPLPLVPVELDQSSPASPSSPSSPLPPYPQQQQRRRADRKQQPPHLITVPPYHRAPITILTGAQIGSEAGDSASASAFAVAAAAKKDTGNDDTGGETENHTPLTPTLPDVAQLARWKDSYLPDDEDRVQEEEEKEEDLPLFSSSLPVAPAPVAVAVAAKSPAPAPAPAAPSFLSRLDAEEVYTAFLGRQAEMDQQEVKEEDEEEEQRVVLPPPQQHPAAPVSAPVRVSVPISMLVHSVAGEEEQYRNENESEGANVLRRPASDDSTRALMSWWPAPVNDNNDNGVDNDDNDNGFWAEEELEWILEHEPEEKENKELQRFRSIAAAAAELSDEEIEWVIETEKETDEIIKEDGGETKHIRMLGVLPPPSSSLRDSTVPVYDPLRKQEHVRDIEGPLMTWWPGSLENLGFEWTERFYE